jgi:ATP-dependent Lon protease
MAAEYGIDQDFYKTKDIHIHFPEGAVPKDGPSAGVTMLTALISALSGRAVRRDVAMTGEISLRGRVLAIGGLKEKTMAALTFGVRDVLIPEDNMRNLEELDSAVIKGLNFIPCRTAADVLKNALAPSLCSTDAKAERRENTAEFIAAPAISQSIPARCKK